MIANAPFVVSASMSPAMAKTEAHGARDRRARPASPGGGLVLPLAEAKLAVPVLRRHVDRPRIHQALDDGRDAALTLVAAPAGYGKTTAVRAWCESLDAALAWVTFDAGDNDPIRLWTYVATAVDRVRQGLGRAALQQLSASGSLNELSIDALMNGLAAFAEPVVIVLDDLHAVTEPDCLAAIDYALERLPANARLVATTRADPALRLAQLRADGKLKEVRAGALAFTVAEARELLVEHFRLELGEEEIALLNERAEGWPAALVLAGLWLQSAADPTRAVREFGGTHRFVAEYLSNEVFASLDDDLRSFLQEIAVLGRFTAELCEDVLERPDAASSSSQLERSNLFLQRLEREAGSGCTRSSPSSRLPVSPRWNPLRPSGSTSGGRLVQVSGVGGRGDRARGCRRRPRVRGGSSSMTTTFP